ncbi:MAG: hypothetical protein JSV52_15335 [Candidatus Zixiibacteriota bacterium]|nr:MAG: hypothetical protein JSV52_15335 [candidate division Zixibacteria bacterium]
MKTATLTVFITAMICVAWIGCSETISPTESFGDSDVAFSAMAASDVPAAEYPAPGGLVSVEFLGQNLTFWPHTGVDFSSIPQDPINLIFYGKADPRDIRAALLSLDGDRTAYGYWDIPPFNATWDDAIGDVQTGYGDGEGWTGGVIQLACGDYGPVRFHIRLFKIGQWTVGNAHFEVLVDGTADHEVLSWERAEELVLVDMNRAGLLDEAVPMGYSQFIDQAPFRAIPWYIYNFLPPEVRDYIDGPPGDLPEGAFHPVPTDGMIPIFNLADKAPRVPEVRYQDFVIEYGQYVPKPFCSSGPADLIRVDGPVHLVQTAELTDDGTYTVTFRADGELSVTPIDALTFQATGEWLVAVVKEHHDGLMTDHVAQASAMLLQNITPADDPNAGSFLKHLRVNSNGLDAFQILLKCPESDDYVDVTDAGDGQPDLTTPAEK